MDNNSYLFQSRTRITPTEVKLANLKAGNFRLDDQINNNKSFPKRHTRSFFSMYNDQFKVSLPKSNNISIPNIQKHDKAKIQWKDNDLSLYTIQNKNCNNQRVQNTISSINSYNQQLRSTIINQYKIKKNKDIVHFKRRDQDFQSHKSLIRQSQQNPQVIKINNPLLTKYSNKSIGFKTLNLLYKAIIDNSFQRRRKDEFQIHANKLPIINRFNRHKKSQFRQQRQLIQIQNRKHIGIHDLQKKLIKNNDRHKDEDGIHPWDAIEQQIQ